MKTDEILKKRPATWTDVKHSLGDADSALGALTDEAAKDSPDFDECDSWLEEIRNNLNRVERAFDELREKP